MTISFNCGSCGREINVRDDRAGRAGSCPGCGNRVRVPDDDVYDVNAADEDYGDYDDYDDNDPYANAPDPTRKSCSACGEMIKKKAAVCRFCGETFDGRARSKSKRSRGGSDIDDDMSVGDWVVAILCSGIGCIAGIVWMIQGKKKGPKMFGVSLVVGILWGIIRATIEAGNRGQGF